MTLRRGLTVSQGVLRETYRQGSRSTGLLANSGQRPRHEEAGNAQCAFLRSVPRIEQLCGMPVSRACACAEIARLIGPLRPGVAPIAADLRPSGARFKRVSKARQVRCYAVGYESSDTPRARGQKCVGGHMGHKRSEPGSGSTGWHSRRGDLARWETSDGLPLVPTDLIYLRHHVPVH